VKHIRSLVLAWAFVLALQAAALADVTGIIRGHLTAAGAPQAGVTVTAQSDGVTATAVTGADGAFVFPHLPFGRWILGAHRDDRSATAIVDVASDSVAVVSLTLASAQTIGSTRVAGHGISTSPVSLTTFSSSDIQSSPQNQNLNRLIETAPGIVRFSYDEPVAHGYHGVTYELDGVPIPQTTSTSFSQVFDPRDVDSMEVLTGAFPAEFGGERMGALINIVSKRDIDIPHGSETIITPGFGNFSDLQGNISQASRLGSTDVFFNANIQSNTRGLDPPSTTIVHDATSLSDEFLRTITRLGANDTLAFNFSNQYNTYQIPINTTETSVDSIVNLVSQDDVQREYSSFASLNYTHTTRDGAASWQVIPWWRSSRIVYAGDLDADVAALDESPDDCAPSDPPCTLAGLAQDRRASVVGLRLNYTRSSPVHTLKFGVDGSSENFTSNETIVQAGSDPFFDNVAQHGSALAGYAQDTWTPNQALSIASGLRYDFSNGFVQGNQLQPRIGVNLRIAPKTIAHVYYGRLYAAPDLEDTRRDAVVVGGGDPSQLPVYDLKPQTESYYEAGLGQTFGGDVYASLNTWQRNVWNVIDTTQLFPTPIFATYNNALGLAHGVELRVQQKTHATSWFLSASFSQSVAGGISGGTFLFPPDAISDTSLQPEDHDQALAINDAYTRRFGRDARWYATLGSDYGTGYPVEFQNGNGRLTPHLTFDATLGRTPQPGSVGFRITALNLTNDVYLIKVNNGFNTTQYGPGLQVLGEAQLAF
jgi:outer membrane receptor for ferrienterochelin and colicin